MPAGDASRTWFSEMIETLRQEWKPEIELGASNRPPRSAGCYAQRDSFLPRHPAADDVVPCLQPAHTAGSAERLGSISYIRGLVVLALSPQRK